MKSVSRLAALRAGLLAAHFTVAGLLLAGAVLVFLGQPAAIAALGAALLVYLAVRLLLRRYRALFAEASVKEGLLPRLQDSRWLGRTVWTASQVDGWQLLPIHHTKKEFFTRFGFGGTLRGIAVTGGEVSMMYRLLQGNQYRFLPGTLVHATRSSACGQDWLILRREALEPAEREAFCQSCGYGALSLAGTVLEQDFLLYGHTDSLPAEPLLKRVRALAERTPASAIRLAPEYAAVFLQGRFYANALPFRVKATAEMLSADPLTELDAIVELALYR